MLRFSGSFSEDRFLNPGAKILRLGALSFILFAVLFCPGLKLPKAYAAKEGELNSFRLQAGDRLEINVYREPDLAGTYEIDPVGQITFPLVGNIEVAGLKIEEFRQELSTKLKKYLVNPQVNISRAEARIKSISVLGSVSKPGTYDYEPGATLMRLISKAGGFSDLANKRKIKIVRQVGNDKKVLMANGSDIINGKADDPNVGAGDIIFVPESVF